MQTTTLTMTDSQLAEARDWLIECFPAEDADIETADRTTILKAVQKHYAGGVAGFVDDCTPSSERTIYNESAQTFEEFWSQSL